MSIRIEHRIGVAASPEKVWEVIADLDRWSEWNALHPEIRGQIAIGATLEVAEVIEGEPGRLHQVVVPDWIISSTASRVPMRTNSGDTVLPSAGKM